VYAVYKIAQKYFSNLKKPKIWTF